MLNFGVEWTLNKQCRQGDCSFNKLFSEFPPANWPLPTISRRNAAAGLALLERTAQRVASRVQRANALEMLQWPITESPGTGIDHSTTCSRRF